MIPTLLFPGNTKTRYSTLSPSTRAEVSYHRKPIYGPLAAMLGLCALILLARPNWSLYPARALLTRGSAFAVPSNEKILGSVETAGVSRRIVGRVDGKIVLAGWAAFTDPHLALSRIVVLVDGAPRAEVRSFFARSDIAAHFGRQDFVQSGWETSLPLSGLRPGEHNLTVEAFAQTGDSNRLRPVQLRVME